MCAHYHFLVQHKCFSIQGSFCFAEKAKTGKNHAQVLLILAQFRFERLLKINLHKFALISFRKKSKSLYLAPMFPHCRLFPPGCLYFCYYYFGKRAARNQMWHVNGTFDILWQCLRCWLTLWEVDLVVHHLLLSRVPVFITDAGICW